MEEAISFKMLVTIYQITCHITKERIVIKVRVEMSLTHHKGMWEMGDVKLLIPNLGTGWT
jgi:hypothetical protein